MFLGTLFKTGIFVPFGYVKIIFIMEGRNILGTFYMMRIYIMNGPLFGNYKMPERLDVFGNSL
jgi:hypothetical protein